ncbi:N-acyl-D-amino-acid deacylase family protein [Polyangium sorediatum]|uniref:Amidohydrolase family protein n=1 Tax=Polyangium sorediatum TaxID=889274 RepID=A0ABT6NU99_9BACT|nr:amidohydrolase family protein [Polyangium sorediatum]MDI1431924.1 amidohydrolase family protein [Polyangium sorediatum]
MTDEFDLVVRGGDVIDGTGRPRFAADVGIKEGQVAALTVPGAITGKATLDARGLVVAPGFVDIHSHADWLLPLDDHGEILAPMLRQGVTSLVVGNCGHSLAPVTEDSTRLADVSSEILRDRAFPYAWRSTAEMLDAIEARGVAFNVAFLAGHGTIRQSVMGNAPRAPAPDELDALRRATRDALREGAFGLSAGLAYKPGVFAPSDELASLCNVVAEEGAIFTVHGRAYVWISPFYKPMLLGAPHNVRSVDELVTAAKRGGARLQLSHQIFIGRRTWRTYPTVLRRIEEAVASGVDVAFDAFPYTVGNTTINAILPAWVLDHFEERIRDPKVLARLRREFAMFRLALGLDWSDITVTWGGGKASLEPLEGLDIAAIARRLGVSPFDAYVHVSRESSGAARVLIGTYSGDDTDEEPLRAVLSHRLCAFETDAILTRRGRFHNPASFGTFPRVLGRYSRDLGLFSLEEAVRRMTSFPAERVGLPGVGRLAPGHAADLVLFDPLRVGEGGPNAPPVGIDKVVLGGHVVVDRGAMRLDRPRGRVLRRR